MNQIIIAKALNINVEENEKAYSKLDDEQDNDSENILNSGKMQFDVTIADGDIKFPTDLSLLNDSREKSEEINVSLQERFARIDQLYFEAFNEGVYLVEQIERFKKRNGHYPEVVLKDQIYLNR
jgi:hypothetical protein